MKKPKENKNPLTALEKRLHTVSAFITLLFIAYGFFAAPYSYARALNEAVSLLQSVAFYLCRVMGIGDLVQVSVNKIPDVPFIPFLPIAPELFTPLRRASVSHFWQNR